MHADAPAGALSAEKREALKRLSRLADTEGTALYAVGGMVRDLFLFGKAGDLDLVLEGDSLRFGRNAARHLGVSCSVHSRFLTCTLSFPGPFHIDIAAARAETYLRPGALPVVHPADIRQDLKRRDFTVNAMALPIRDGNFGELLDPFNGRADLDKHLLRSLHPKSFSDDPTRIFRAVRFAARLDFSIESKTRGQISGALKSGAFDTLSGARIKKEIKLWGREPDPTAVFRTAGNLGIPIHLVPDLAWNPKITIKALCAAMDFLRTNSEIEERVWLIALAAASAACAPEVLRRLSSRLALDSEDEAVFQNGLMPPADVRKALEMSEMTRGEVFSHLSKMDPAALVILRLLEKGGTARERLTDYLENHGTLTLDITGDDLINAGFRPSAQFGRVLRQVLSARIDGRVKTRDEQLEMALGLLREKRKQ